MVVEEVEVALEETEVKAALEEAEVEVSLYLDTHTEMETRAAHPIS